MRTSKQRACTRVVSLMCAPAGRRSTLLETIDASAPPPQERYLLILVHEIKVVPLPVEHTGVVAEHIAKQNPLLGGSRPTFPGTAPSILYFCLVTVAALCVGCRNVVPAHA